MNTKEIPKEMEKMTVEQVLLFLNKLPPEMLLSEAFEEIANILRALPDAFNGMVRIFDILAGVKTNYNLPYSKNKLSPEDEERFHKESIEAMKNGEKPYNPANLIKDFYEEKPSEVKTSDDLPYSKNRLSPEDEELYKKESAEAMKNGKTYTDPQEIIDDCLKD